MSLLADIVDISSDEETEMVDVKPSTALITLQGKPSHKGTNFQQNNEDQVIRPKSEIICNPNIANCVPVGSRIADNRSSFAPPGFHTVSTPPGFHTVSTPPGASVPQCRQFWKSGDYEVGQASNAVSRDGKNCLRIHPKFLHSNATSHKWAFGAIAELLDNAVDEVQHGATFVIVDKILNPRNGSPALLILDDGGGMDPENLRLCMSFGFSDKQFGSSIGQYGNGFKTSTMRLGADVLVFSRCMNKRTLTQSVGLLSYTFLRQTGCDDIVVPMVDYEFNPSSTGKFVRLYRHGERHFSSNISTLLKWSPFATEAELLKQFDDIGHHGTKVIIFNLWFNDEGDMELDFESDPLDIMLSGAPKIVEKGTTGKMISKKHIANQLRYSLRVYTSILYMHLPPNFRIFLRGQVVEPHCLINDLQFIECIKYKPQVAGRTEVECITTVGFLKGAPEVNVHGFNVYHKNRLILPFWRVVSYSDGKGRGVSGVLEANFIKPTHDKQDFEKSTLYHRLETRLKEITVEYWNFHSHLVGYPVKKTPSSRPPQSAPPHSGFQNNTKPVGMNLGASSDPRTGRELVTALHAPMHTTPVQFSNNYNANSQTGLPEKRRHESHATATKSSKRLVLAGGNVAGTENNHKMQLDDGDGQQQKQDIMVMMKQNNKLRAECLEYEKREEELVVKVQKLRDELSEVQRFSGRLLIKSKSMSEVKVENL